MTQYQAEKQQIRTLLDLKKVPSDITLYNLAHTTLRAIQLDPQSQDYARLLTACVVVIRYYDMANKQRQNFLSTFRGRKALSTLAQVVRQQRDLGNISQIFDYKN